MILKTSDFLGLWEKRIFIILDLSVPFKFFTICIFTFI